MIDRIHPSNLERNILLFIVGWRQRLRESGDILQRLRHEYLLSNEQIRLKPIFDEAVRYLCNSTDLDTWLNWKAPSFPVNGNMLIQKWGVKGRDLKMFLQGLRTIWVDSGCRMDAEALLNDKMFEEVSQMPPDVFDRDTPIPAKRRR